MPEYFIVTITNVGARFETDLEIPSRLPLRAFKGKLLEILKIMDGQTFGGWDDYRISFNNRVLYGSDTLASLGAFDGSRLAVERA
ncbi:MAG: EsaB/YukD family protein [Defluviitaleaceae bacterium]|nr:EsaB/YukD family protein [Defluviitaleaceae bacterium]